MTGPNHKEELQIKTLAALEICSVAANENKTMTLHRNRRERIEDQARMSCNEKNLQTRGRMEAGTACVRSSGESTCWRKNSNGKTNPCGGSQNES
jgi:hypothetical protein